MIKPDQKVRGHLTSGQKAKKQRNKTWKKHVFFSVVFHFCLDKSKCNPWRNLFVFNFWGICCKKNMIFYTFFGICFISHLILRNKKCMTNSKKVRFLAFYPTLLNKKSFFQHFFYIFVTKKFSISHHIINNYFFFFYAHPRANIQKNVDISVPIDFVD